MRSPPMRSNQGRFPRGGLCPLNRLVMLAQRKRASLRTHRLRQLAEALVEQVSGARREWRLSPPTRGCETFIEPIDARPEGLVPSNVGNDKASGIRRHGFGPKHVERILKASCERLVGTNRLHERAIHRSPALEGGVEPFLVDLVAVVAREKLPELRGARRVAGRPKRAATCAAPASLLLSPVAGANA